jgi:2-keto-3-deoxy-L-fuconate dehydrogenase
MFNLSNRTAIITGAGSGIGKAAAILLAKQGARIHVIDINEAQAQETANEINHLSGIPNGNRSGIPNGGPSASKARASAHALDVSNQEQVQSLFSSFPKTQTGILVNSAGVSHIGTAETTAEEDFDRLYRVNVKGVYNCLRASIPIMKANGGGIIVNMSSIAASVGLPDRFAYSMTKGAVSAMTLSVAKDFIKENIRCNCISPARVHTPFVDGFLTKNYPGKEAEMFEKLSKTQPIGRMAKPEEIAALILYLCSDEASFITGCDYPIDGGFLKLSN